MGEGGTLDLGLSFPRDGNKMISHFNGSSLLNMLTIENHYSSDKTLLFFSEALNEKTRSILNFCNQSR